MPEIKAPEPQKPMTQHERILKLLTDAGSKGVPNYTFSKYGILQHGARISELRNDGSNIYCERQVLNGKPTGVWMYYLND